MGLLQLLEGKKKETNSVVLKEIYTISGNLPPQVVTPSNTEEMEKQPNGKMATEDGEEQSLIKLQRLQTENGIDCSSDNRMVIKRPVYSQAKFDEGFKCDKRQHETLPSYCKKQLEHCHCSSCLQFLPFIGIMRKYSLKKDFFSDLVAGLTVGIMHIPQGMAYGLLAQLPPIHGLYVSFFPVLIYFFFGTSKHVSVGTFAVVCLMVGAVVDKGYSQYSSHGNVDLVTNTSTPTTTTTMLMTSGTLFTNAMNSSTTMSTPSTDADTIKLGFAMAVTFLVGCIQLLMGVFRLGFVTTFLSDPLVSGFTTGAACHVFTSQIKHIFGIQMGRYSGPFKLIYSYIDVFSNISQTNLVTFGMSAVSVLIIALVKELINNNPKIKPKLKMPVPIELVMVILGTVISYFLKLNDYHHVRIVGKIATGIPTPLPPPFSLLREVVTDAIAIAIVAFAINVSMCKILAKKHDYEIDPNQELLAYAFCNIFSSFFSAFCSAVSLSRSLVQENAGGRTQVTGLISSILILIVLLVVGPLFETLPNCVLAAIIIVALKGMFKQFTELRRLWGISKIDFAIWLVAFLGTALLDVDYGLGVGVGFSLITVLGRSSRPYSCLLGQMPNTDIYRDISVYRSASEIPGIKIFRFDSSLYFANCENFRSRLYELTGVNPRKLKKKQQKAEKKKKKMVESGSANGLHEIPTTTVKAIIIDCSSWSYLDSVGVKVLSQVISEYDAVDVRVLLAHCKAGIREMLVKAGFYNNADRYCLFVTVHDAVLSFVHPTFRPLGLVREEKKTEPTTSQFEDGQPGQQLTVSVN